MIIFNLSDMYKLVDPDGKTSGALAQLTLMPFALAFCSGVLIAVWALTQMLLRYDIGMLSYVVIPTAILISAFILYVAVYFVAAIHFISARIMYSAVAVYFITPAAHSAGLFGKSDVSLLVLAVLVFIAFLLLLTILIKNKVVAKSIYNTLLIIFGIVAIYILLVISVDLSVAADWVSRETLDALNTKGLLGLNL